MKTIWQYWRTGGKELQVSDDFPMQVPFTSVSPLEGIDLEDQFYIPSENRWKEIMNALDRDKLDNLEVFYTALKKDHDELTSKAETLSELNAKLMLNDVALKEENTALKEKADSLAEIHSKTMLASLQNTKDIAEIKSQLNVETNQENTDKDELEGVK